MLHGPLSSCWGIAWRARPAASLPSRLVPAMAAQRRSRFVCASATTRARAGKRGSGESPAGMGVILRGSRSAAPTGSATRPSCVVRGRAYLLTCHLRHRRAAVGVHRECLHAAVVPHPHRARDRGRLRDCHRLHGGVRPRDRRGQLSIIQQWMITVGILVSYLVAVVVLVALPHSAGGFDWRFILGIGALPAIVAVALRSRMPESPRWLMLHDRYVDTQEGVRPAGDGDHRRGDPYRCGAAAGQGGRTAAQDAVDTRA